MKRELPKGITATSTESSPWGGRTILSASSDKQRHPVLASGDHCLARFNRIGDVPCCTKCANPTFPSTSTPTTKAVPRTLYTIHHRYLPRTGKQTQRTLAIGQVSHRILSHCFKLLVLAGLQEYPNDGRCCSDDNSIERCALAASLVLRCLYDRG